MTHEKIEAFRAAASRPASSERAEQERYSEGAEQGRTAGTEEQAGTAYPGGDYAEIETRMLAHIMADPRRAGEVTTHKMARIAHAGQVLSELYTRSPKMMRDVGKSADYGFGGNRKQRRAMKPRKKKGKR